MDFSQLKRPTRNAKPLDPIAIFERRPSLPNTPNDLWRGQTEALNEWHKHRTKSDVFIALNTGAGKTLVGLLVAQRKEFCAESSWKLEGLASKVKLKSMQSLEVAS